MRPPQGVTSAIIAHYGSEPGDPLWVLAEEVQQQLAAALGDDFVPRDPATVHTTVLGLDDTDEAVHVRLAELARELVAQPLLLQAGGWPDADLAVSSRGRRLRERTVSRFGDVLVLLAWPVESVGVPTMRLDSLRRELVAAGGRHRYPLDAEHQDPDAHLVIGRLREGADTTAADRALARARDLLARTPRLLRVDPDDLSVVTYDDITLPRATTRVTRPWGPPAPR